jgi:hypothetical protein
MSYSENQLTALAKNNPKELVRIITSPNSDVHALTFGAEILGGEVTDESLVLPALRRLLKHINAVVREGAMNGLSAFYIDKNPPQDVLDRLKKMAADDPSPACKDLATSLLENYSK